MTAASVTTRGRAAAEAIMVDTCTITRPGAGGTYNTGTFQTVPASRTTVYSGKCRIKSRETLGQELLVAGQGVTLARYIVSVPWDTTGIEVGDTVTITASYDPGAVRDLIVQSVEAATFTTARRLLCSDDQG